MNIKDVFIVIVLYKTSLKDSKTIKSLLISLEEPVNLLIFDNSPQKQYEDYFVYEKFNVTYKFDILNPGLSFAYNVALKEASKLNLDWILLLDQDTTFSKEYFDEIKKLNLTQLPEELVSIIPNVIALEGDKIISPSKMLSGGMCRPVSIKSGIISTPISAINSGTLINVSFMNSINGFPSRFTLDMLDHWYFREIFKFKKKVYLLNATIKQELSVYNNFEDNVSFERYKQMVIAEFNFIIDEGIVNTLVFKSRLIVRVLKQMGYEDKRYWKYTFKELFRLT